MNPSQNLDGNGDPGALSTTLQLAGSEPAASTLRIAAVTTPQFLIDGVTMAPPGSSQLAVDPVGPGVAQAVNAPAAEAEFGVTGAGVKIGILSDSFNVLSGAAQDQADGALPASGVTVLAEGPAGSTDEGRAMAEIVHSIAPGAQLLFATSTGGEQAFANNITALVSAGAKIIVDDITYFAEPFFQDGGPIDQAIEAAEAKGVQFFTAAGNEASNFIQGTFNPIETTLPGSAQQVTAENFGNGSALLPVTIGADATIDFDLQWAQPFGSFGSGQTSQNSLALEVFDPTNPSQPLVVSTVSNDVVGGDPVQVVGVTNTGSAATVEVAIVDNGSVTNNGVITHATPVGQTFKLIALGDGQSVTIDSPNAGSGSGTVFGHHEIAAEDAVGAVDFTETPALGLSPPLLEPFSSIGPGEILFGNNGIPLASPENPGQVKFTAPDGDTTSLSGDLSPFFGTSAAAPAAAAIAALIDQEDPTLSFQQVTSLLQESSVAMSDDPATGVGAGLVQANTAVALAAEMVAPTTTVVGTGMNFFGSGEADEFERVESSGQLEAVPQNGSPVLLTTNGSVVTIDTSTAVIGAGEDFFGSGDGRALFLRNGAGILSVLAFNPGTGQEQTGETLTNWADSPGTAVIGAGEDYLRFDELDIFQRLSSGQLEMGQFDSTGRADFALFFTNWAVDSSSTVIGAGEDFLGSGESDVFFRLGTGQLEMGEFNSAGRADYALFFTNWAVDAATTVIGGGEDYFDSGEHDVFQRLGTGQLEMGEFNAAGQADYALFFTNWAVDTGTTVVGAGEDLFGSGERDVFFRLASGQLQMGQFDSSGRADSALFFTNANGSAFTIETGTRVTGVVTDSQNNPEVTLQTSTGAVEIFDFSQSNRLAPTNAASVAATSSFSSANTLAGSQLSQLVQAMASFAPAGAGVGSPALVDQSENTMPQIGISSFHHA